MCKYCRSIINQEFEDEWNPIICETVCVNRVPLIIFDVAISGDSKEPYIYSSMDNPYSSGNPIIEKKIPIKYCPFCGEKLKED